MIFSSLSRFRSNYCVLWIIATKFFYTLNAFCMQCTHRIRKVNVNVMPNTAAHTIFSVVHIIQPSLNNKNKLIVTQWVNWWNNHVNYVGIGQFAFHNALHLESINIPLRQLNRKKVIETLILWQWQNKIKNNRVDIYVQLVSICNVQLVFWENWLKIEANKKCVFFFQFKAITLISQSASNISFPSVWYNWNLERIHDTVIASNWMHI